MGRTKKNTNTVELTRPHTRASKAKDPDIVGQVTKNVTAEFDSRFARLERAIEAMAGLARDKDSPPNRRKRASPKGNEQAQSKKKPRVEKQVPVQDELSVSFIEPEMPKRNPVQSDARNTIEHVIPAAQPQRPVLQPETQGANVNNNKTWSTWLADNVTMNPSKDPQSALPLSVKDVTMIQELGSKVHDILNYTSTRIAKGNANKTGEFPFQYVSRGPEKCKATTNSLNLPKHIWGIICMIKDSAVPAAYKPALLDHIEQICDDCREYDWPSVVRRWSEEVFSLVLENRHEKGWLAKHDIQMLRLTISRDSTARLQQHKDLYPRARQAQAPAQPTPDAFRGGPPCPDYNSTRGCSLQPGHMMHGKKMLHICTFCLMNSASTFPHPETFCRNKSRVNSAHFQ